MEKPSANPEHNRPLVPEQERAKAEMERLRQYHSAAGSMELFYDMYPFERPAERGRDR